LKSVLINPETWEPSVTVTEVMTFEKTDESDNDQENDADDKDETDSDMVDIVSISSPMSPDADPDVDPDEIVIISARVAAAVRSAVQL